MVIFTDLEILEVRQQHHKEQAKHFQNIGDYALSKMHLGLYLTQLEKMHLYIKTVGDVNDDL